MSGVSTRRYVTVPVTTLWTSPTAPRAVDEWAVATPPDVDAWLTAMDAADARPGLHGRALTQLELGEPVDFRGSSADGRWLEVVAPMQPSRLDPRGYPGWVPAEHVNAERPDGLPLATTNSPAPASATGPLVAAPGAAAPSAAVPGAAAPGAAGPAAEAFIAQARTHLGLPYLWGGMCDWGLDCSGLVHLSLRRLGVLFPRDADDQYDACEPIPAADALPGDLIFFAHEGKRPHHVGIVTGPGRMLHAPETGSLIVEEALSPARRDSVVGAGRVRSLVVGPVTSPTDPTELTERGPRSGSTDR